MKNRLRQFKITFGTMFLLSILFRYAVGYKGLTTGGWQIRFDDRKGGVSPYKRSKNICEGLYASYLRGEQTATTCGYVRHKVSTRKISDAFGKGTLYKIEYTDKFLPKLAQYFYLYPDREYILMEFSTEGKNDVVSNQITPVSVDRMAELPLAGDNRALLMPLDNDKWIRYQSHALNSDALTSYEVTAVFNNEGCSGLVVGSVEHDNWKTAVMLGEGDHRNIGSLTCYGGVANELTWDMKPYGALKGKKIKSPKILLGFFENWCNGLETYAKVDAIIPPPKEWGKAVPFGWNSWGALQFSLTHEKTTEVSDFVKQNLQSNHFANPDHTVYVGLDSGWDCMNEEQLKSFITECKSNGQIGGICWTPFTDWARDSERTVDAVPEYKYKGIYLYVNGKSQELDGACAIGPTHPAVEATMKKMSSLFHRTGFEYVKMDFMTHGAMEADKWCSPEVTTGIQGYNYGMRLLDKHFGDMYINLSISPVFPVQYAQLRRVACNAWNKVKDTEHTLNALSYGWWQKYIYRLNDADHIMLRDATDSENRARITSGIITGIYIGGDGLSAAGGKDGEGKVLKYLTNPDINTLATGEVFRSVEGNGAQSEQIFVRKEKNGTFHYALFNYSGQEQTVTLSLDRIGLEQIHNYQVKELWSGSRTTAKNKIEATISAKDVEVLEFN